MEQHYDGEGNFKHCGVYPFDHQFLNGLCWSLTPLLLHQPIFHSLILQVSRRSRLVLLVTRKSLLSRRSRIKLMTTKKTRALLLNKRSGLEGVEQEEQFRRHFEKGYNLPDQQYELWLQKTTMILYITSTVTSGHSGVLLKPAPFADLSTLTHFA